MDYSANDRSHRAAPCPSKLRPPSDKAIAANKRQPSLSVRGGAEVLLGNAHAHTHVHALSLLRPFLFPECRTHGSRPLAT